MRTDQDFLQDILSNAQLIQRFVSETTRVGFEQEDMRKMAVEKGIERIGEAMKNISPDLKERYPDVDWSGFPKMRDRTSHGYWSVDYEIVWYTAIREVPLLRDQIVEILNREFEE